MSEDTTLAILGKEMYKHFGSMESRRHSFFTFVYAFLLGSVANFAAGFIANTISIQYSLLLSLVSTGILLLMLVFLLKKQTMILGIPNAFYQKILIQKKSEKIEKEVYSAVSSMIKSKAPSDVSIKEETNKIVLTKKRLLFGKKLCIMESMATTKLGGSIEVTLTYCNDEEGEEFCEEFLDDFYFYLRNNAYNVFLDVDSRPFGRLFLQSRFSMIDKFMEELPKK